MKEKSGVIISTGILIFIVISVLLVSGVVFFTLNEKKEEEIKTGVDDKGVKLKIYGWKDGKIIGPLSGEEKGELPSLLEFNPPSTTYEIDAISIEHTITSPSALSDVDVNITDLQGSFTTDSIGGDLSGDGDARYESSISGLSQTFTLSPGEFHTEMSSPISITDLEDDCNGLPYCEFKLQILSSFQDVNPDTGEEITTNIPLNESYGTIIIKVTSETCSDGTPYGECSSSSPGGKFCDASDDLINCAAPTGCTSVRYGAKSCPCNPDYYETNGDAICSAPMCDGGIAAGLCVGIDALICDPNCITESCGATIQDCYECGQAGQNQGIPLGWLNITSNAAECPPAYNGDLASSCHELQHTCKYKGKKGAVSVVVAGN